jgi:hypothetical protein
MLSLSELYVQQPSGFSILTHILKVKTQPKAVIVTATKTDLTKVDLTTATPP